MKIQIESTATHSRPGVHDRICSVVSTVQAYRPRGMLFRRDRCLARSLAHGGSRAYYRPSTDSIVLPHFETFRDAESYYATLAHETTHWTAHESRLARDFGGKRFGSEGYAIEELVAELGAAFLCADLDLTLEPREDHAPGWHSLTARDSAHRRFENLHSLPAEPRRWCCAPRRA